MKNLIIKLASKASLASKDQKTIDSIDPRIAEFARLIIEECAAFVDSKTESSGGEAVMWADGKDVREHFGLQNQQQTNR